MKVGLGWGLLMFGHTLWMDTGDHHKVLTFTFNRIGLGFLGERGRKHPARRSGGREVGNFVCVWLVGDVCKVDIVVVAVVKPYHNNLFIHIWKCMTGQPT